MSSLPNSINNINNTSFYATTVYAYNASGGFQMERFFDPSFREFDIIPRFDVTDSVQVLFDVAVLNAKLGLYKNATNDALVSSSFEKVEDVFTAANGSEISEITITSTDFKSGLNVNGKQVISVGKFASLYSDFKKYVSSYFGFDGGYSSLFAAASEFNIDTKNVFNGASFVRLLNGESKNANGSYINDLSGNITISNITKLLRFAVDSNCFGNRTPGTSDASGYYVDGSGTAIDPSYNSNYGVEDGFMAGDLIWVPSGTTITLKLNIDSETFLPFNNVGPSFAATNYSQTTSYNAPNFSQTINATRNQIMKTVQAPLLIKLVDASTITNL